MDNPAMLLEVWKKTVDVQQHFNDLELRIRNFAIVLIGAIMGLGSYAMKDGGVVHFLGIEISRASLIVATSIIPLSAFYLMDRGWYHRLLKGSVKAGAELEQKLKDAGVTVTLGDEIGKASPLTIRKWKIHSDQKMDIFYGLLLIAIVILFAVLMKGTGSTQISGPAFNPAQLDALNQSTAKSICNSYVSDILAEASSRAGTLILDPRSGRTIAFIDGKWTLVPQC